MARATPRWALIPCPGRYRQKKKMEARDGNVKDVMRWTTKVTGFHSCRGCWCAFEMLGGDSSCVYATLFEDSVWCGAKMLPFNSIGTGRVRVDIERPTRDCRSPTFVYVDLVDADTDPEIVQALIDRVAEEAERRLLRLHADLRIAQNPAQVPGK
jgi:hypothetical protein